jgi:hypothetical protein
MPRLLLVLCMTSALLGCIGGDAVRLEHDPPVIAEDAVLAPIGLAVEDKREVVTRLQKESWYLGRTGDDDLVNFHNIPLAHQIRNDLVKELKSLGYDDVGDKEVRRIEIQVWDWTIDSARKRTLRYDLKVKVLDRVDGRVLTEVDLRDETPMAGDDGNAIQASLNAVYAAVIRKLVRENTKVMAALKS